MDRTECLNEISFNIARLLGLHYPENRLKDLERLVHSAAKELKREENVETINTWLRAYQLPTDELLILSEHLRVGETYFFREETALSLFREVIIPQIIKQCQDKDKHIRIWSAGCSSGEEPYTLAMILHECIPDLNKWNVSILATDISLLALNKAIHGKYTSWSFRQTDQAIKDKYFIARGKEWEVIPEIKKMVTFARLNLADYSYDAAASNSDQMDMIFCRNVLMYFTPEKAAAAGLRFFNSLVEKGWFISSQVELSEEYFSPFKRINFGNGIFYQKAPKPASANHFNFFDTKLIEIEEPAKYIPGSISLPKPIHQVAEALEQLSEKANSHDPEKLFCRGHYQQCADQCLKIFHKTPDNVKNLLLLIKSYANIGKLEEAKTWSEKLLTTQKLSTDSYQFIATIFSELGEYVSAESALKKALYLDHNNVSALLAMGNVMKRQGKTQGASRSFENANEILEMMDHDAPIPGFEGLTAGRVKEMLGLYIK
jgi:chemotaxis protein methyltransferase CheR